MSNLTRSTMRPATPRTRLLVVRPSMRSVRQHDEPDPSALRLAVGTVSAVGALAFLWLMGLLGGQMGFARLIGVPELEVGAVGSIVTAVQMLIAVPGVILRAGLEQPILMMAGFVLIALPAGALAAARPLTPGGPRRSASAQALLVTGAVVTMLAAVLLAWWALSPWRATRLAPLPTEPVQAEAWLAGVRVIAGLDVLAFIAAAVWLVLAARLPVMRWLRALTITIIAVAAVLVTLGTAVSHGAATELAADRSMAVVRADGPDRSARRRLLLGYARQHPVLLEATATGTVVRFTEPGVSLRIVGRSTVADVLRDAAAMARQP